MFGKGRCELCDGILDSKTLRCRDCGLDHSQYEKMDATQRKFDRRVSYTPRVDYTTISDKVNAKKKQKIENIRTAGVDKNKIVKPQRYSARANTYNSASRKSPLSTIIKVIIVLNVINAILGFISRSFF